MKTKSKDIIMQNKVFIWLAAITGFILLIPFFAMRITTEMNWSLFDFVIAGFLLFGTGATYVLGARMTSKYRALIGIVLFIALVLIWAELAVGLFGSPFAGD